MKAINYACFELEEKTTATLKRTKTILLTLYEINSPGPLPEEN